MKKTMFIIAFTAISILAFAQIQDAEEVIVSRTIGETNGWKIFVPKASSKILQQNFKRWMKEYNVKIEKNKKTGEIVAKDVVIPSMGQAACHIYTIYSETSEGAYLTSFVGIGDVYVTSSSHIEKAIEWRRLVKKLAAETTADIIEDELAREQKKLQSQNRNLEKLKKEGATFKKDIEDCETKIEDRKEQLIKNGKAQVDAQSNIAKKTKEVDKIKNELKLYTP